MESITEGATVPEQGEQEWKVLLKEQPYLCRESRNGKYY